MDICLLCRVLPGRGLCDELITRPEESYRLWCVVCDLETSRIDAPYIYDISSLRVKSHFPLPHQSLQGRYLTLWPAKCWFTDETPSPKTMDVMCFLVSVFKHLRGRWQIQVYGYSTNFELIKFYDLSNFMCKDIKINNLSKKMCYI